MPMQPRRPRCGPGIKLHERCCGKGRPCACRAHWAGLSEATPAGYCRLFWCFEDQADRLRQDGIGGPLPLPLSCRHMTVMYSQHLAKIVAVNDAVKKAFDPGTTGGSNVRLEDRMGEKSAETVGDALDKRRGLMPSTVAATRD